VAGYFRDKLIFDVDIDVSSAGKRINLTGYRKSSTSLRRPHGLCFIDDETLVAISMAKFPS
jgi:hypothetical protein